MLLSYFEPVITEQAYSSLTSLSLTRPRLFSAARWLSLPEALASFECSLPRTFWRIFRSLLTNKNSVKGWTYDETETTQDAALWQKGYFELNWQMGRHFELKWCFQLKSISLAITWKKYFFFVLINDRKYFLCKVLKYKIKSKSVDTLGIV